MFVPAVVPPVGTRFTVRVRKTNRNCLGYFQAPHTPEWLWSEENITTPKLRPFNIMDVVELEVELRPNLRLRVLSARFIENEFRAGL
jgi:hypothetical protein